MIIILVMNFQANFHYLDNDHELVTSPEKGFVIIILVTSFQEILHDRYIGNEYSKNHYLQRLQCLKTEISMYWDPFLVFGGDREAAGWVGENSVVSELGRVDDFGAQDVVGQLVEWVVFEILGECIE